MKRILAGVLVAACALAGSWLWVRDSALVAVRDVRVDGLASAEAPQIRSALSSAALDMTTLHVRASQLNTAVEPFPAVEAVEAHADFPHRLRIVVHEHAAVGAIVAGSQRLAVAADGTLLRDTPTRGLPVIAMPVSPGGDRLADRGALRAAALLATAPSPLRARIRRVYVGPRGLTVPLQNGPILYFGGADRLRAKWTAATVVLGDRSSAGATYVDVRLPERPAACCLESAAPAAADAGTGSQAAQPTDATAQP